MQQVRIRLWRAQGGSEQIAGAPASYVYRTAVSAALDLIRRRQARRFDQTVSMEENEDIGSSATSPEGDLEFSELAQRVAGALEEIPASRRPVVRMYLAGYPRQEIADLLGWSEAKTRNLLYRGLDDLRGRLKAMGIGWEVAR